MLKGINLSKQIGMYRATLCEGITSFYWETSRRDLELLVFVRIAGLEKRKRDLELPTCASCIFPTNDADGNYFMRYITVWIIV